VGVVYGNGRNGDVRILEGVDGGIVGCTVRSPRESFLVGVEDLFDCKNEGDSEDSEEDEEQRLHHVSMNRRGRNRGTHNAPWRCRRDHQESLSPF